MLSAKLLLLRTRWLAIAATASNVFDGMESEIKLRHSIESSSSS
jgi:hypothetical protein